jgi:hypothetical protein
MSGTEYVRDEDKEEYRKFCMHHARGFGRAMPAELWHYTDANGLIGILKTGQIWSTQITCLNDSLEQRYFGDLVHASVKIRRAQNTDPILEPLLRIADVALDNRDFAPIGQFVACFSEIEDDLGQWRGYGGGECGYAIGFRSQGILDAAQSRPGSLLVPMNYEDNRHNVIVNDVVRMGEIYYRQGLSRWASGRRKMGKRICRCLRLRTEFRCMCSETPKIYRRSGTSDSDASSTW